MLPQPPSDPGVSARDGQGFVDIHAHVLPGFDDGPATMDDAVRMLNLARSAGTAVLVASPHSSPAFAYDRARTESMLDQLCARAPSGLRLVRGCDFHLTFTNVERALVSPGDFAINGRCWLLMELSELTVFSNTSALWAQMEEAGLRIIVTHPERNPLLRQRFDVIGDWVAGGRLMQLTAGSLLGDFGREAQQFSLRLLDAGLAHFVASDAHDLEARPPRLDLAFDWLAAHYSPEYALKLCVEHPQAVVEGQPIDLSSFHPPARKRRAAWWRRLWPLPGNR